MNSCFCIGRQNGEPYCPCEMKNKGIIKRNGRWIEPEKDLGECSDFWKTVQSNKEIVKTWPKWMQNITISAEAVMTAKFLKRR